MDDGWSDAISEQNLIKKIVSVLDAEVRKPYKKMDADLVDECVDFLMEPRQERRLSKEEIGERVARIPFVNDYRKKKTGFKRTSLLAACITVLLLLLALFALGKAFPCAFDKFGDLIKNMVVGQVREVGNVTLYKGGAVTKYDSIGELLGKEGLNILYPTWLPDNQTVQSVNFYEIEGIKEVAFTAINPDEVSVIVQLDIALSADIRIKADAIETVAGLTCYITDGEIFSQISFAYGGNVYTVLAPTFDGAVKIIESIKTVS